MRYTIKVVPNSKHPEVIREGDVLKIKVHAPAKEGKANEKLLGLLAEYFDIPVSRIKIVSGYASKNKVVEIL